MKHQEKDKRLSLFKFIMYLTIILCLLSISFAKATNKNIILFKKNHHALFEEDVYEEVVYIYEGEDYLRREATLNELRRAWREGWLSEALDSYDDLCNPRQSNTMEKGKP